MSPNAGRILRRRPRPSRLRPPERDAVTGRYARSRPHDDKGHHRARLTSHAAQARRRLRIGLAIAGVVIAGVIVVLLVSREDGDSVGQDNVTTTSTAPSTTATPVTSAAPPTTSTPPSTAATTLAPASTAAATTSVAPPTTLAGPATLAEALVGRYQVTSVVISDSLVPERAGSTQPWLPLQLSLECSTDPCTVSDVTWGIAALADDALTFTFHNESQCLGATRTLDTLIDMVVAERDALGAVQLLTGTGTLTWSDAGQCPGFVEEYALTATRT